MKWSKQREDGYIDHVSECGAFVIAKGHQTHDPLHPWSLLRDGKLCDNYADVANAKRAASRNPIPERFVSTSRKRPRKVPSL